MSTLNQVGSNDFERARIEFLKVEAEVMESLQNIECEPLMGKPLSNAQHFLRGLCIRGFLIEDIAKQTDISVKVLHSILGLKRRDLSHKDFSSLIFFHCAVACGYVSPTSLTPAMNDAHFKC